MSKKVPLDAPWKAPKAAEWDARSLGDWLDANIKTKLARDLFDAGLETVYAASGTSISLLHALFYVHSGGNLDILLGTEGGAQATRIVGGMQPVAEKLAATLGDGVVRLSCPVRRIENGGERVIVHHDGGAGARIARRHRDPPEARPRDSLRAAAEGSARRAREEDADGRGHQAHRRLRPAVLARSTSSPEWS